MALIAATHTVTAIPGLLSFSAPLSTRAATTTCPLSSTATASSSSTLFQPTSASTTQFNPFPTRRVPSLLSLSDAAPPPPADSRGVPVVPDKVVSVAVDYARYYWRYRDVFIDLPLRVAAAGLIPPSRIPEVVFNVHVVCATEWYYEFDETDSLTLDVCDEYASKVLSSEENTRKVSYDEMLSELAAILIGKYVVLDDYPALLETLRCELPTYHFFDVATNVLVRNEALRRGAHYWQRTHDTVAPLADLWPAFFDAPLDARNTAAVASGLRTIFMKSSASTLTTFIFLRRRSLQFARGTRRQPPDDVSQLSSTLSDCPAAIARASTTHSANVNGVALNSRAASRLRSSLMSAMNWTTGRRET